MNILGDDIRIGALKRWVAHLLLLALVSRALIPVGYMPDFSAAAKGAFKVVICSAMGAQTIALDEGGKPHLPDQSNGHHEQPCAFSGLAAVALPALDAIPIVIAEFRNSALIPRVVVQLPPTRAGPVLGSRGPPQLS
ncbi:MAG: DUF2946 family protein [Hyphomicrobium sp.]